MRSATSRAPSQGTIDAPSDLDLAGEPLGLYPFALALAGDGRIALGGLMIETDYPGALWVFDPP
jgi:hypothetical protein